MLFVKNFVSRECNEFAKFEKKKNLGSEFMSIYYYVDAHAHSAIQQFSVATKEKEYDAITNVTQCRQQKPGDHKNIPLVWRLM